MIRESYVYGLKDGRTFPSRLFYIGKGVGSRRFDHLHLNDESRKWQHIQQMRNDGVEPEVVVLVENLTDAEAIKIESELILSFGTIDSGGCLLNSVIPSGFRRSSKIQIQYTQKTVEKAQIALALLKSAISELASMNESGVTNAEVASVLGLRTEHQGNQKDYLTYSVLGLLLRDGTLEKSQKLKGRYILKR